MAAAAKSGLRRSQRIMERVAQEEAAEAKRKPRAEPKPKAAAKAKESEPKRKARAEPKRKEPPPPPPPPAPKGRAKTPATPKAKGREPLPTGASTPRTAHTPVARVAPPKSTLQVKESLVESMYAPVATGSRHSARLAEVRARLGGQDPPKAEQDGKAPGRGRSRQAKAVAAKAIPPPPKPAPAKAAAKARTASAAKPQVSPPVDVPCYSQATSPYVGSDEEVLEADLARATSPPQDGSDEELVPDLARATSPPHEGSEEEAADLARATSPPSGGSDEEPVVPDLSLETSPVREAFDEEAGPPEASRATSPMHDASDEEPAAASSLAAPTTPRAKQATRAPTTPSARRAATPAESRAATPVASASARGTPVAFSGHGGATSSQAGGPRNTSTPSIQAFKASLAETMYAAAPAGVRHSERIAQFRAQRVWEATPVAVPVTPRTAAKAPADRAAKRARVGEPEAAASGVNAARKATPVPTPVAQRLASARATPAHTPAPTPVAQRPASARATPAGTPVARLATAKVKVAPLKRPAGSGEEVEAADPLQARRLLQQVEEANARAALAEQRARQLAEDFLRSEAEREATHRQLNISEYRSEQLHRQVRAFTYHDRNPKPAPRAPRAKAATNVPADAQQRAAELIATAPPRPAANEPAPLAEAEAYDPREEEAKREAWRKQCPSKLGLEDSKSASSTRGEARKEWGDKDFGDWILKKAKAPEYFTSALGSYWGEGQKVQKLVLEKHAEWNKDVKVFISRDALIEAGPYRDLPPKIFFPGLQMEGPYTVVMRNLQLEKKHGQDEAFSPRSGTPNSNRAIVFGSKGGSFYAENCNFKGPLVFRDFETVQFVKCTLTGSLLEGLSCKDCRNVTLTGCTVREAWADGIHFAAPNLKGSCLFALTDCEILSNRGHGVQVHGAEVTMRGCSILENSGFGVWSSIPAESCLLDCNLIFANAKGDIGGDIVAAVTPDASSLPNPCSFRPGAECKVWREQSGEWIPGIVTDVKNYIVQVLIPILPAKAQWHNVNIMSLSTTKKLAKVRRKTSLPPTKIQMEKRWFRGDRVRQAHTGPSFPADSDVGLTERGVLAYLAQGGYSRQTWKDLAPHLRQHLRHQAFQREWGAKA